MRTKHFPAILLRPVNDAIRFSSDIDQAESDFDEEMRTSDSSVSSSNLVPASLLDPVVIFMTRNFADKSALAIVRDLGLQYIQITLVKLPRCS